MVNAVRSTANELLAKPPVAMTVTLSPISAFIRRYKAFHLTYITIEHTSLHRGYGIPANDLTWISLHQYVVI